MSFAYNANCVAVGGNIVLPTPGIISSQASVTLAPSGGAGQQIIQKFDYNNIVKFDEAVAHVTGSFDGTYFNTSSTITITKLNVRDFLQVDFLVATIISKHAIGADEGEITFGGTSVDNLKISGNRVEPRFNPGFFARYPTHKEMLGVMNEKVGASVCPHVKSWVDEIVNAKAKGNPDEERKLRADLGSQNVATLVADRFCWDRAATNNGAPTPGGNIHCSLVDDIPGIEEMTEADEAEIPAADLSKFHPIRRYGYVITVEGLGKIKLAEVIIKPGEKRFNMFRFELGSPVSGSVTVGSAGTNGTELIP